jgi:CBS domain-containing protein
MGRQDVEDKDQPEAVRSFTKALLLDLRALEQMLRDERIESDVRRIGAEQELFLVDKGFRPAPVAMEVLERLGGPPFTTELARFNLEINLDPILMAGDCFSVVQGRLEELIERVREAAKEDDAQVVITGILPTLLQSDLSMENITPRPRYYALNEALNRMREGAYRLRIEGTDELLIEHDSVMLEACNTSSQIHLQVSAEEFARFYNAAQAVLGPVVAAAVNSPLLFGRRLWAETRIALFQQSLDTRSASVHMREMSSRVRFGEHWVERSVTELFQEDIARFRVLIAGEVEEDPLEVLRQGGVPKLRALQMHNSTVYRWNRPCYGISEGQPHLRIECRALPAGPTVLDEVANAVLWIGLVLGVAEEYPEIHRGMAFDDAKTNFLAASRMGLRAGMRWLNGETIGVGELILDRLLPLAQEGLAGAGVDEGDIDRYLGVIRERVRSGNTGADWARRSLLGMKDEGTPAERLAALTAATVRQQIEGKPVHRWKLPQLKEAGGWQKNYMRVEQYMTTDLFTVHEDELVDLVAFLMDRKHIRHVLVEDGQHRLVGIVSYRSVLRLMAEGRSWGEGKTPPVKEIMERRPITVSPDTPTLEAIDLMREHRVSCVPVIGDGKLVGMVSERDFMPIAYEMLASRLQEEP